MRVDRIDPKNRPDLFFMTRDTGEVDENLDPIYKDDLSFVEQTEATGKRLKRKREGGGTRDIHVDTDVVRIYKDDILAVSYVLQIGHKPIASGSWSTVTIPLGNFTMLNGVISASTIQPGYTAQVSVDTKTGDWAVHIEAPGRLLRIRWMIQWPVPVRDPDVKFGYDDYTGNVNDDEGYPVQTIDFEPAGIEEEITIGQVIPVRKEASGGNRLRLTDSVHIVTSNGIIHDTLELTDSIITVP